MTTGWKDPGGKGRSPAQFKADQNQTKAPEPFLKDGEIAHGAGRSTSSSGGRSSGSVTYDYSAIDEARSARSKANQLQGTAAKAAYDGHLWSYELAMPSEGCSNKPVKPTSKDHVFER